MRSIGWRTILSTTAAAIVAVGCVSVSAPTALPGPTTTLGITTPAPQTPTATPTTQPTASPSPSPTTEVTATPSSSASPAPTESAVPSGSAQPSAAVPIDFGADTIEFYDDFSITTSGWGTGSNDGGTVAYADEALRFDTTANGSWIWSRRLLDDAWNVLRVEGSLTPSGPGYAGLMCATDDNDLYGLVANGDGLYVFLHLTSTGAEVISTGQEPGWAMQPGTSNQMALDCAGTSTGVFRLQASRPALGVVANFESTEGPASFDRAAVYAEASSDGFSLFVDDVYVYGGTEFSAGQPSAEVNNLLAHVPEAWRETCVETPVSSFDFGAFVAVVCTPQNSDIVEYVQFDDKANLDVAYQARIDSWAVEPTGDCETGPDETGYSIGGAPAGRALCAPSVVGVRLDWTHDELLILTTLTDFDGSYADNYADWLLAGPI
jgi:hypothetical protein